MARDLDCSPTLWRTEAGALDDVALVRLSEMASILGLELAVSLHPVGDPIHDKGQQPLARRFEALLTPDLVGHQRGTPANAR